MKMSKVALQMIGLVVVGVVMAPETDVSPYAKTLSTGLISNGPTDRPVLNDLVKYVDDDGWRKMCDHYDIAQVHERGGPVYHLMWNNNSTWPHFPQITWPSLLNTSELNIESCNDARCIRPSTDSMGWCACAIGLDNPITITGHGRVGPMKQINLTLRDQEVIDTPQARRAHAETWYNLPRTLDRLKADIMRLSAVRELVHYLKESADCDGGAFAGTDFSSIVNPMNVESKRVRAVLAERAAQVVAYASAGELTDEFLGAVRSRFDKVVAAHKDLPTEVDEVAIRVADGLKGLYRTAWYADRGWTDRTIGELPMMVRLAPRVEAVGEDGEVLRAQSVHESEEEQTVAVMDPRSAEEIAADEALEHIQREVESLGKAKAAMEAKILSLTAQAVVLEKQREETEKRREAVIDEEEARLMEQVRAARARKLGSARVSVAPPVSSSPQASTSVPASPSRATPASPAASRGGSDASSTASPARSESGSISSSWVAPPSGNRA